VEITILNTNHEIIGTLSNDTPLTCPFWEDTQVQKLTDFDSGYDFTVPSDHDESDLLVEGNFIIIPDPDDDLILYRIKEVEDGILDSSTGVHLKKVTCLDAYIFDLSTTVVMPKTFTNALGDEVFSYILEGSGWAINRTDFIGMLSTYNINSMMSAQKAMQALVRSSTANDPNNSLDSGDITNYLCEPKFYIKIKGGRISDYCVDLYLKRGEDAGKVIEYSKDMVGITRTADFSNVFTALKLVGGQDSNGNTITVSSVNNGLDYVYDDDANELYNPGGTGYIMGIATNTKITDPNELLAWGKTKIQQFNHPNYIYTVAVIMLEQYGFIGDKMRLGDTVRILDRKMNPPAVAEARVIEMDISYSNPSQNKVVLGDFLTLSLGNTPPSIESLQVQVQSQQAQLDTIQNNISYSVKVISSNGTAFKNGVINTGLIAKVYKNNDEISGTLSASAFTWTKTNSDGTQDTAWNNTHLGIGNSVAITQTDFTNVATFNCSVNINSSTIDQSQITLSNINDGIVTSQPTTPANNALWLDTTVTPNMLKEWDGTKWNNLAQMSPTLVDSLNELNTSISNMTNDSLLDFKERQTVKQNISNIIGYVIDDATLTLPTTDLLDANGKGSFYEVRRGALNAGILTTDANYTGLTNAYNTLSSYLVGLIHGIPPWNTTIANKDATITIDPTTFRTNWMNYYIAEDTLNSATSTQLQNNINTVSTSVTGIDTRLTNVELTTTPNSIVSTVTSSDTYGFDLSKKADSSDLGNYATNDQLTQAKQDSQNYTQQQIAKIDYSPYVTQAQLTQTNNSINAKVSMGGGVNLVKNSVGLKQTDFWTVTGTVKPVQNDELKQLGYQSGFQDTAGVSGSLSQTIYTTVGIDYTLSFYMRKDTDGTSDAALGIYLYDANNGLVKFTGLDTNTGKTSGYQQFTYTWTARTTTHTIKPSWGANTTGVITGQMVNIGDTFLQWSMATGELYAENVSVDINGLEISQGINGIETGRMVITSEKIAAYHDANNDGVIDESDGSPDEVFLVSQGQFVMNMAVVKSEITMGSLKAVVTNSGGWAFVRNSQ
jgi:hypothetical protein